MKFRAGILASAWLYGYEICEGAVGPRQEQNILQDSCSSTFHSCTIRLRVPGIGHAVTSDIPTRLPSVGFSPYGGPAAVPPKACFFMRM